MAKKQWLIAECDKDSFCTEIESVELMGEFKYLGFIVDGKL